VQIFVANQNQNMILVALTELSVALSFAQLALEQV
jgi:hypothetical protein